MTAIPAQALALIESFEGFSATPYNDGTGVMTIGYGTTSADVSPLPSHLTRAQASALLARKLESKYMPAVDALGVLLNPNQQAALLSLAYNCGTGCFGWQIGIDLRAKRYQAAAEDFGRYVNAGGRVLQGLVTRRAAERRLFETPWVAPDPEHYLWFDPTSRLMHGGRHANERETVEEYDRLRAHPRLHARRLGRLRDNLSVMAGRLETLMEDGQSTGFRREWRHGQLEGRAAGRRYV